MKNSIVNDVNLFLPDNHNLLLYAKLYPLYDTALARLVKFVDKASNIKFVDIGANVGDTCAIVNHSRPSDFICIEGDPEYFEYLDLNISNLQKKIENKIIIEKSFCGKPQNNKFSLSRHTGTSSLIEDTNGTINIDSLDNILKKHSEFLYNIDFIKIDSDGFEIEVLEGASSFFENNHPSIHIEYDRSDLTQKGKDYKKIFELFKTYSYKHCIVYDNLGSPVRILEITNFSDIDELSRLVELGYCQYYDLFFPGTNLTKSLDEIFVNEVITCNKILRIKYHDLIENHTKLINVNTTFINEIQKYKDIIQMKDEKEDPINLIQDELNKIRSKNNSKEKFISSVNNNILKNLINEDHTNNLTVDEINDNYLNNEAKYLEKFASQIGELNKLEELLSNYHNLQNDYARLINSKEYKISKKISKGIDSFAPQSSPQRKLLSKTFKFSKKLRNRQNVQLTNKAPLSININSNKILYIGHSYHKKTSSTRFLINYLKTFFEVEEWADESWLNGKKLDYSLINESYRAVIFFQQLPYITILNQLNNANILFFPMYDSYPSLDRDYWIKLKNIKIVNFSKTLNDFHKKIGLNSIYVQFFPELQSYKPGNPKEAFFWQRVERLNINNIDKLLGDNNKIQLHVHKATDPGNNFIKPSISQELKYNISYSDWVADKNDMWNKYISEKGIYFAPRISEGIGMSFLEPMSVGKIVVAVNNPTMNEYIIDGYNGLLYKYGNEIQLNFDNFEKISKNTYDYMKDGYNEWTKNKFNIIKFLNS